MTTLAQRRSAAARKGWRSRRRMMFSREAIFIASPKVRGGDQGGGIDGGFCRRPGAQQPKSGTAAETEFACWEEGSSFACTAG